MEEIRQILAGLDWSPLFISIKTGIAATIVSFFLGIWAARKMLKAKTGLRAVLDGILTLPLVLPPTVAGFFLLLIFSTRRTVGSYLYTTFDIKIVQSWAGCVIAATVIAFPLMYRNARAAFEQVDVNLIYAAQTLGMPEWKIFWRVIMPAAAALELHPVQFLHLQERLENMVRPPCLRAIFQERRQPFPRGLQWSSRTVIIRRQVCGSEL